MSIRIIDGIGEIVGAYDGLILDLWGVLHDGQHPYPGVLDALTRLKAAGKRVVILSNAPRRAEPIGERIAEIGIPPGLYDAIHSSGEEAWQHLHRRDEPFYQALGQRFYHIGPPRDEGVGAGHGLTHVETPEEAEFILNTGPWGWEDKTDNYEPMLESAARRDLPMICVNPDLVVMHRGRMMFCAGALAKRYEEFGGRVRWHGKPFPSVYETCFDLLGIHDRRRVLAVGDSLRTDITGANGAGIDSLLVTGGIHAEELWLAAGERPDPERLAAAIAAGKATPTAAIGHFTW